MFIDVFDTENATVILIVFSSRIENRIRAIPRKCVARAGDGLLELFPKDNNETDLRITVFAPNKKLSTSSDRTPSMMPMRLR